jgi:hypothetical protein
VNHVMRVLVLALFVAAYGVSGYGCLFLKYFRVCSSN